MRELKERLEYLSPNKRLHPTGLSWRLGRLVGFAVGSLSGGVLPGPPGG